MKLLNSRTDNRPSWLESNSLNRRRIMRIVHFFSSSYWNFFNATLNSCIVSRPSPSLSRRRNTYSYRGASAEGFPAPFDSELSVLIIPLRFFCSVILILAYSSLSAMRFACTILL